MTEQTPNLGHQLVTEVLAPMKLNFVGKDEIIDLLGVCLVGGENLFLLGPPGTAKSAIVFEIGRRLSGTTFTYLLTRFTEPNEIFGPFDIRKLREGDLVTNTEGMLPEASLVFLDELLNANSAILNSLLTVLNERVYRRGRETRKLPMITAIGASNHLPEDASLEALFDRFLLRVHCDAVPDERLGDVLSAGWRIEREALDSGETPTQFSFEDIRELNRRLLHVDLNEVRQPIVELVNRLRQAGIVISDRRAVKLQRLVAASALLCGRDTAARSDLWVFRYIWDHLEQEEILKSLVDDAVGDASDEELAHPRTRSGDVPDPEILGRDVRTLQEKVKQDLSPDDAHQIRDHLRVLANRVQWIVNAESRSYLQQEIESLWGTVKEEA